MARRRFRGRKAPAVSRNEMLATVVNRCQEQVETLAKEQLDRFWNFETGDPSSRPASRTLRDSLGWSEPVIDVGGASGVVNSPWFWAETVHDGRGPRYAGDPVWGEDVVGGKLVWFWNPADDPRTNGGRNYPLNVSDVRHFTEPQFKELLARKKLYDAGGIPFMFICREVGPVNVKTRFFTDGQNPLSGRLAEDKRILKSFEEYVAGLLPPKDFFGKASLTIKITQA